MNCHQDVCARASLSSKVVDGATLRRATGFVRWALVVAVAGVFMPSCKKGSDASVPITDPATGQVIGHKDPATGKYMFTNGMVVTPQQDQLIPPEVLDGLTAKLDRKFVKLGRGGSGHGASASGGGGSCNGCWSLVEGSVGCQGCCTPAGNGACSCWEYCWDNQTSRSGGGMQK